MAQQFLSYSEVLKEVGVARSTFDDWRARGEGPQYYTLPRS